MGYTKSENAIKRMEFYLEALSKATDKITWKAAEPVKFAQQLREAFNVAEEKKHERYGKLKNNFRIKVDQKKNLVFAELKKSIDYSSMAVEIRHVSKIAIPEINNLSGIVGAAISNKNYQEIQFPDAHLGTSDLSTLYKWTSVNKYYIISDVNGVTLTREEVASAWKPE